MKTFRVRQYQWSSIEMEVEAETLAQALAKVISSDTDCLYGDEYNEPEPDFQMGMSLDDLPEGLEDELMALQDDYNELLTCHELHILPSIHSWEEVADEPAPLKGMSNDAT